MSYITRKNLIINDPSLMKDDDFFKLKSELRRRKTFFYSGLLGTPVAFYFITGNKNLFVLPLILGYFLGDYLSKSSYLDTEISRCLQTKSHNSTGYDRDLLTANGLRSDKFDVYGMEKPTTFVEEYLKNERNHYK